MGQARERRRQAGEVRVAVTKVARSHDVTTTEVRLAAGEWPFDPIATVWTDDDRRVVDLHCLMRMDGDEATFESYDLTGELPQPGGPYRIFSWWDPNQFRAATDRTVRWHRRTYNKPGDHTHCLLTWEAIDHGTTAYQVDDAGWITVDAYEKYIRDDMLRLRRAIANP
jgi:hypothetical protein